MIESPKVFSLEERVREARNRLVLIQAAGRADADLFDEEGAWEILAAIVEAAAEAQDLLDGLSGMPGKVANWTPDMRTLSEAADERTQ